MTRLKRISSIFYFIFKEYLLSKTNLMIMIISFQGYPVLSVRVSMEEVASSKINILGI